MAPDLRAHRYFSFINPRRWWLCVRACARVFVLSVCVFCTPVLISRSPRSKTGLRQYIIGPGQPPQPELHLPAQPAQRRPRPGGGRRGGRRRLRPPAPAAATPHPSPALPHLLQHPRLAKKHKFPVHPSFHPLHPSLPFRWVRLSTSAPGSGTGTGQPLRSRATGPQTRIRWEKTLLKSVANLCRFLLESRGKEGLKEASIRL